MFDFSKQISKFHENRVKLTNDQRADMRRRRGANHDRIVAGLAELGKPEVVATVNQGGYAQWTMVQPPESDLESRYDIDMGVVFEEAKAAGPRLCRGWVRDAIARKATGMKNEPVSKPKCVRVEYAAGYQCDFPVFRRLWTGTGWKYELAAGDEWVASDPEAMNEWIRLQVWAKSPETEGSYQLRRVIRFTKYFAKVHAHRLRVSFPGGLVATALAVEAYQIYEGRDDLSFRETLRTLAQRSEYAPVYANGSQVSDDKDIDRIRRLIAAAKEAVEALDKLEGDVSVADAYKAWKKVFRHSFFQEAEAKASAFAGLETKSSLGGLGLAAPALASTVAAALADTERADRLRAAAEVRKQSGGGEAPWAV